MESRDWSSDVCSSDLPKPQLLVTSCLLVDSLPGRVGRLAPGLEGRLSLWLPLHLAQESGEAWLLSALSSFPCSPLLSSFLPPCVSYLFTPVSFLLFFFNLLVSPLFFLPCSSMTFPVFYFLPLYFPRVPFLFILYSSWWHQGEAFPQLSPPEGFFFSLF